MEQKTGIIIKIGTAVVQVLAISLIAVVVLFRPNQNAQEPTILPHSIQEEEDIPEKKPTQESDPTAHRRRSRVARAAGERSVRNGGGRGAYGTSPSAEKHRADAEDYEIYVVQRGATLSVIAKAYSMEFGRTITVQEIKDANDMKSDVLTPGQELIIPKR